jgi:hypothetical protein
MAWFKVDDGFHSSRKVLRIPKRTRFAAVGLWSVAGSWSVKENTSGVIPSFVLKELSGSKHLASQLVASGLWEIVPGGWKFANWRSSQDGDYRRNIRPAIRQAVMERDNHACVFCGSRDALSLDHIIRYRDDGPDTVDNLRVLCMPCNLERG